MLETITALLASTTFMIGAWVVIAILMAILLEFEKEGWATTFFSLGIALLLWNFRTDIWTFISSNPTATIGFTVSYVLAGITWSFFKWNAYVKGVFSKIKEVKDDFIRKHKAITDDNRESFISWIEHLKLRDSDGYIINFNYKMNMEQVVEKVTPIASKKKSIITSWISYWPVSLMATLLNNPFRKFFEWVYDNLSGYYDKITTSQKQTLLD
jgi:hypothetical protein